MIELSTLKEIMEAIRENDFPKSKQVEVFIREVLDHFEDIREGQ